MRFLKRQRPRQDRRRQPRVVCSLEVLESRLALTAGITAHAGAPLMAVTNVPLTNAVVATFTLDDASTPAGTQRRAHVEWGDGAIDKMLTPIPVSGNTFKVLDSHTYTTPGVFTITVKISVPMMPATINTVTTTATVTNTPPPPPPPPPRRHVPSDFDGNGQSDLVVFDPQTALWSLRLTNATGTVINGLRFGNPTDTPLLGDIDGNGQTDLLVFDPATAKWSIRLTNQAGTTLNGLPFGAVGDIPLLGDFDGNGQSDLVAFDPATAHWSIRLTNSVGTTFTLPFGIAGDIPLVGDFDGNGQSDLAVFDPRTAKWSIRLTNPTGTTFNGLPFGTTNDIPLVGDFDGNGQSDLAVYNPQTAQWSIRLTSLASTVFNLPFGTPAGVAVGSTPLLGDFDGNGQTDLAVFDSKTAAWQLRLTNAVGTTFKLQFGASGDVPALSSTYPSSGSGRGRAAILNAAPTVSSGLPGMAQSQIDTMMLVPLPPSDSAALPAFSTMAATPARAKSSSVSLITSLQDPGTA